MWLPPKAVLPSRLNTTWQEWPSCSDWLGGQILSLSWELWLQCSQGFRSGPLFQLISCTALHPKSCFLSSNVKAQAKQLRVSALVTIYPRQQGFAGGGLENSIMKTCLLQLGISAEFPARRGMGQSPSCRQSHRGGGKAARICCQKWTC